MLVTSQDVHDITAVEMTVITLEEMNPYPKIFIFENLTAVTLAAKIQESSDGGNTYEDIGSAFNIGPAGRGSEVETRYITSSNLLRVRAAGGGNDRDLLLSIGRYYKSGPATWRPSQ